MQPSAVTACAISTTSLISIVFNKKPDNQFFIFLIKFQLSKRVFIMTTNSLSYFLTKTYSSHYAILILNKNLFQPLKLSILTPGGSRYFNPW